MLTSLSARRRRGIGLRGWHQRFQAQPPFQELHLLTKPPAGGTEAEFVHGEAAVLDRPVDRRLHWSPLIREHWSCALPASYTVGARHDTGNGRLRWESAGQCTIETERDDGRSSV